MTDYEDYDEKYYQDLDWQEKRQQLAEFEKNVARYTSEKQQAQTIQKQNEIFKNALGEAGLTVEEYNEILALDPNFAEKAYTAHVKFMVHTVKERKRDPKTGRFIPQSQTRQEQVKQKYVAPQPQSHEASGRIQELKEKARTGKITDAEREEALDMFIGNLYE